MNIINSCSGTVPTGTPISLWALCGLTAVSGSERSLPSYGRSWRYFYGHRTGIQLSETERSKKIPPLRWTKHALVYGCSSNKHQFILSFFAFHYVRNQGALFLWVCFSFFCFPLLKGTFWNIFKRIVRLFTNC